MTIVGQPKTTAQYIQVSGRVGRRARTPGLVITIYGAAKPRDRSHYERFRTYHQQLYAQVEPTSVTPFADAGAAAGASRGRRLAHAADRARTSSRIRSRKREFDEAIALLRERAVLADSGRAAGASTTWARTSARGSGQTGSGPSGKPTSSAATPSRG